ncbi:MAG: hypothetical protein ACOCW8_03440 [bacterium]
MKIRVLSLIATSSVLVICFFLGSPLVKAQNDGDFYEKGEDHGSGATGASIRLKQGTSDRGGDVELHAGEGQLSQGGPVPGDIWLKASGSYDKGGSIYLNPGNAYDDNKGKVYLGTPNNTFFDYHGNLTIELINADDIDADDINILQEIKIGPRYKPDLKIGKYTQGSLGSYSNPTMIASPVSVKRELILFGKKEGRLDLRMYDGSLKFGPDDDNLKAIIKRDGTAQFKELKIEDHPTADFVFEDDYNLRSLDEVDTYIKEHKHLPDIPSAEEMEDSGVNLAEMNKLLLQKIEELTLYAIEKEKEVEGLEQQLQEQSEDFKSIEDRLTQVEQALEP